MTNKIIIFTGPSAVGKATIEKELFKDKKLKLKLAVSATTRKARINEIEGIHYYFVTKEEFNKNIQENNFLEWNEHFSNKYGTLKSEIKKIQENNKIPFLEVEIIGAKNLIKKFKKEEIITIFIAPPSIESLKNRILKRNTETKKQIEERLNRVKEEMLYKNMFSYKVVNDNLKETVEQIKKIIYKEIWNKN